MQKTTETRLSYRRCWMLAGFAAAFGIGDVFLAVRGASTSSVEFLLGVAGFSLAHLLWTVGQLREARPDWRVFVTVGIPLSLFSFGRLLAVLPTAAGFAVCAYALLSALSLSVAAATRRVFYACGIGLLLVSDLLIGGRLLHAPGCGAIAGITYIAAEACLLASFFSGDERRFGSKRRNAWPAGLLCGVAAFVCFLVAALCWPGGGYNPFMRMLSSLGRTAVNGVGYPLCHFLFMAGMGFAAVGVAAVFWCAHTRFSGWRRTCARWGAATNIAGLLAIALVPEDTSQTLHNVGCWLAAGGGAMLLFSRDRRGIDRLWTCLLAAVCSTFTAFFVLHGIDVLPFAPWFPTTQKILIALFALWTGSVAARERTDPLCLRHKIALCLLALIAVSTTALSHPLRWHDSLPAADGADASRPDLPPTLPPTTDERAALKWLDHVTGKMTPAEEKEWWDIGGTQHGLFAKRYNIAFCGYAAAALGMRGNAAEREIAGRILGNCIERYLKREVWAYSMSKNYWGKKPWAPDPCYRENVMYTGHLLQLLALYETFTGDARYWKDGFDFVWSGDKRVHYTVKKLIDVTVYQMRKGPNGGVTCEPGLMFFPCNNHPHIALALFARLGHGDWTDDARRWEKWALDHYVGPLFGGGSLNLLYHVPSGIFYPRGHGGLDGWSLLWYEPWASDRRAALKLWKSAAAGIDWEGIETGVDARKGGMDCCDPVDVPPITVATFLAAAARACDDPATAERLERIASRSVVRRDGMLYLDVGRDWRIGATANFIISLAYARGASFRSLLRNAALP